MKPRVVELFAGAGFFGFAFKRAGFELVRAIEIDAPAAKTYESNLGDHIELADVTKTTPSRCEVLIAGPPCQGFSTLGKRQESDPRNNLCFEVIRWAKAVRPKVVVVENVEAFLQSTHWRKVVRSLTCLGYQVTSQVLDAADFGCAQFRRRSFTFACRSGEIQIRTPTRAKRPSVREAWDGLSRNPDGDNMHVAPRPSGIALKRMKRIPPGGDRRDLMRVAPELTPISWHKLGPQVTDAWGRMLWDEPSNTLRTCFQNASKGRYIHPSQNRVISIREAARLHSIPDSWKFDGFASHVAKQIGNGVPPSLGFAIARAVRLLF